VVKHKWIKFLFHLKKVRTRDSLSHIVFETSTHQQSTHQHINTEISEIVVLVINHSNEMTFNTNKPFLGMPWSRTSIASHTHQQTQEEQPYTKCQSTHEETNHNHWKRTRIESNRIESKIEGIENRIESYCLSACIPIKAKFTSKQTALTQH
jgi:hypothetical protein